MGFAEEIQSARSTAKADTPQASAEAAPTDVEIMNTGLPTGSDPVDPAAKVEPVMNAPQAKIKIGNQEFQSMDEAVEYAQTLELARAQDAAYIEGMKAATPPVTAAEAKQKELEELVEEKFFEDPKTALKMFKEGITKQIFDDYQKIITQQEQAKTQQQNLTTLWNNFYQSNADLSESKDVVEFLRQKHWNEIKDLPQDKALGMLAETARKQLKITKEATLPRKELPDGPAITAGASGDATITTSAPEVEKSLDFIAQLNKIRKRNQL